MQCHPLRGMFFRYRPALVPCGKSGGHAPAARSGSGTRLAGPICVSTCAPWPLMLSSSTKKKNKNRAEMLTVTL